MQNKLNGIEDTLYIPLVARIYVSKRFPNFFYDEKALSLLPYIPLNTIDNNSNEYYYMASVCRQYTIDQIIKKFLIKHPKSNIVYLGAGLETSYNRLNNDKAYFYQLDLPIVIKKRKEVLGKGRNEILLEGDLFLTSWVNHIDKSLPTLVVVAGVFQYYHEEKVVNFIRELAKCIPNGEIVFDITNSKGLKIANKYVKKTGNKEAEMHFCVDNPMSFAKKCDTKLLEVKGFFCDALANCKGLKFKTKIFMSFADKLQRTMILHLKLGNK
ncbi:MAG: class I SAM-dependent methyltransferase [Bacilli bacterium]|nr:class I SAM-dependent methyltransferase [Bacilli bacterium]